LRERGRKPKKPKIEQECGPVIGLNPHHGLCLAFRVVEDDVAISSRIQPPNPNESVNLLAAAIGRRRFHFAHLGRKDLPSRSYQYNFW
jgi:hypothetical protein